MLLLVLRWRDPAVRFLFAAYIATWVIHGFYLSTLVRRFGKLRRELKDVGRGK
jgi:CcmD family protein